MNSKDTEIYKLELLLDEARKSYNSVDESFKENRSRMFILFSAELALMTYLFSDIMNMIPEEIYGKVIFAIACIGILFSTGLLFAFYRSIFNWPSPIGPTDREKIRQKKTKKEVLEYAINDYVESRDAGHKILKRNAKILNLSMQIFIISAIILMIIKIF